MFFFIAPLLFFSKVFLSWNENNTRKHTLLFTLCFSLSHRSGINFMNKCVISDLRKGKNDEQENCTKVIICSPPPPQTLHLMAPYCILSLDVVKSVLVGDFWHCENNCLRPVRSRTKPSLRLSAFRQLIFSFYFNLTIHFPSPLNRPPPQFRS